MKVVVKRNEKESNERLIARFNKKVQGSRKLLLVRAIRYNSKKPTRRYMRAAAVMRENYRKMREVNKFY